ncbi:F-box protein [Senna tora]|uniref:F-box protein n=1 Tax=Senna tora TaxID=362788 RepID=A0A834WQ77_9FABA|nr:F-box protein [Senna tora]
MKKGQKYTHDLPSDVLNIIAKKLDIDDLFSFGEVSKHWRTCQSIFWHNFLEWQAPLVIQKSAHAKRSCSFFSIVESRMYNSFLTYFSGFAHVESSSGYMIMAGAENILMLINVFKRRQMKIPMVQNPTCIYDLYDKAILAYAMNTQEFVIVTLCSSWAYDLHVYQSRNSSWIIYSRWGNLNLVSSDRQLLVVHFKACMYLEFYKIDLSTMEWTRIHTIVDCALFMSGTKCTSLSNPGMWGFDSNCVYSIDRISPGCRVFTLNNKLKKTIPLPENRPPLKARLCNFDWCFLHQREEINYTLHE